jgi:hypothetical protein
MKFLTDILARAGLVVEGVVSLNSVANATIDTDKFLTIDSGVVKFRTGAQLLSDIGGQSLLTNPVTGTGTSGQVAYFNGTSSLTSSATFAFTPTSQLLVNNSVTAASAIARGTNLTPTLTAAANNDVLVGLDINPTYTAGAFTGLYRYGLRVEGILIGQGANTAANNQNIAIGQNTSNSIAPLQNLTTGTSNIAIGSYAGGETATGSNNINIGIGAGAQRQGANPRSGSNNVAIGNGANLYYSVSNTVVIGNSAGNANSSDGAIIIGAGATGGGGNQGSTNVVIIGTSATATGTGGNQIVIGASGVGLGGNTTVLGNSSTTFARIWGNLGLGTSTNSGFLLDVNGTARVSGAATLSNLAGTGTRMVVADANGLLSTQAIASGAVTGTGTTNYIPKFTSSSSIGNSIIFDDGNCIGINTSSPYSASQFKLDVNGGFIVKNTSGVNAQFVMINSDPAAGGNNAFFVQTVGGATTTTWAQIQTYYGTSIASGALRLQPAGGFVLVGSSTQITGNGLFQVAGDINITGAFRVNGVAISTSSMVYPSAGIAVSTGSAWGTSITDNSSNWNTAYGWGNHASVGYLTSSTAASIYLSQVDASNSYLTQSSAASIYLSQVNAANSYLTQSSAASIYLSQVNAANSYLSQSSAASIYLSQVNASNTYLSQSSAASIYASLSGSYSNPSWITSLAYSKITGVPAFLTSYSETDTLNSVTGRGATTSNTIQIGKLGIGRAAGSNESISVENPEGTWLIQGFRSGSSIGGLHTNSGVLHVQAADVRIQASSTATWNGDTLATRPWVTSQGYITGSYLPLSGGTLTGALSGTSAGFTGNVTWQGINNGNPRSLAIGYSGGNYGQAGYGVTYTSGGAHNYAINDIVSLWEAYDGIRVLAAGAGTVGTAISWTTVLDARRSTFTWMGNTVYHAGNLTNLNQLSNGPGYITASFLSSYLPLSGGTMTGNVQFNANLLQFNNSGVRSWNMGVSGGNLNIYSGDGSGGLQFNGRFVRDSVLRTISGQSDNYSGGTSGWYEVATITLTGNCSGAVLYGTLYDNRYDGADAYQISVVARADCEFSANNEAHYINVGCTILGSTNYTNYRDKIRVVLVASSAGSRTYELQFFETPWNNDTWQLETTGWTIFSSPQAPGSAVGTPRVNYISNKNADNIRANTTMTVGGSTVWHAGNLTNLNQLTNGPGYITSSGSISGNSATTSQRSFSGDISTDGMGRFTGWYTGTAATGLAAEIGISAGQAYIIAYNRQTSTYGTLNLESASATLRLSGSTVNVVSGALQQGGNQVLHAGNYTSYAPAMIYGNSGAFDLNVSGQQGFIRFSQGTWVNTPNPGNWSHVLSFNGSSDNRTVQLYMGDIPGAIWWRMNQGGTQHPWERIWTSNNLTNLNQLTNGPGYITGITSGMVTGALGYTPVQPNGTGASGTWGISITGASASATDALRIRFNDGPRNLSDRVPNTLARSVNWDFVGSGTVGGTGNYAGVMSFTPWDGTTPSTGDSSYQLAFMNETGINGSGLPGLRIRKGIDTTWGSWHTLLHAGNFNSYSPTLTGGNASGTWSINVTGTAGSETLGTVTGRGASTASQVSFTKTDDHAIQVGTIRGRAVGSQSGEFIQLYERVNIGGPSGWGASNTSAPSFGLSVYGGANIGYGNNASLFAYAYRGNGNVGGTGEASWHPAGIYSGGTQWFYGTTYRNNASTWNQGQMYFDGNFGYGMVGLYNASRYQAIFAMGDSYKLPVDGTSTGSLYGMAWSHPNAGGVASNLNTHGLLVMENGTFLAAVSGSIRARDDMRAPRYYSTLSSGTMFSHGAMNDAFGYNGSYGTYIGSPVGGTYYIYGNGTFWDNGTIRTFLHSGNFTTWAQQRVYQGQSAGDWQTFTNDVGEFRVDEVLNINAGGHSNQPPNVYTYGGVLSWRTNNHSFQLYASHTGDITFKTQWGNDNYSGWRRILHEANYNSWVPSLTGGGASGTWGISITGSAGSASSATFLNSSNYINRCGSSGNANTDFQNTPAGSVRHNGDDANLSNSPGGTWWFYDNYRHSNGGNFWGTQVAWGWEDNAHRLATRNISGNSFSGWVYYINSNNLTSYMDAPNKAGTSYYQTNTWMQMNGTHGIYWPSYYGAHLYVNTTTSYTQFRWDGQKNGYDGVWLSYSAVNGMMYDSGGNGGVYREANGRWYWYHHVGNNCTGISTSTTSSSYRAYIGGSLYAEGDVVAYSDVRKKTDIVTIDNALEKVTNLRGVYYTRIDDTARGRQTGVIAQEINQVLPEVVTYASDVDEYGVSYGNIVGVLIEAIKEQQTQIEELKTLVNALTK